MSAEPNIKRLSLRSELLRNNPAGEPDERPVYAYLPEHAAQHPDATYPALYLLAPWTNAGRSQFDWKPFRESLPELLLRLERAGAIPPTVVVAVDLYTRYGGSQYIDSAYFGPHGSHIVRELIPFCESNLPIKPGAAHRAVLGRSSGGYGALRLALDFPGEFAGAACHSGDLGFEMMFGGDLHTFCDRLARYDGDVSAYLADALAGPKVSGGDVHMLMLLGMCGFYSPNPSSPRGFDLPVDPYSGAIDRGVLERWYAHDPVRMVERDATPLKKLKALYVECGLYDQYHLLYGARQLHQHLAKAGIEHRYEEFKDNHSGTEYRYAESLPYLLGAMGT